MHEEPDDDLPIIPHMAFVADKPSQEEAIIDPDRPIIDSHFHFSELWGGYFIHDLCRDIHAGHNIVSTVYIQCGHAYRSTGPDFLKPVGETEYVVTQAELLGESASSIVGGIVGFADLTLGDEVDHVLSAHVAAGRGRFRGIRQAAAQHRSFRHGVLARPRAGLYSTAEFRDGYAKLEKYGLSFDAWAYHTQLDEVVSLAKAFPAIALVVDHTGGMLGVGPYANDRPVAFREWSTAMKRLARCPNVRVKLGGFGIATFGFDFSASRYAPDSEVLAKLWTPYIEPCIDTFGADRCMFESNFPVDRGIARYVVLWNAFKRIAATGTPSERSALFYSTAAQTYQLTPDVVSV